MNKKIDYETPEVEITWFRTMADIMAGDDDGDIFEEETHLSGLEDTEPMPGFQGNSGKELEYEKKNE